MAPLDLLRIGVRLQLETCLWVVILQAGGVRRSCEKRNFHLRHQRVIDGHVGQTQPIWRPPVGYVGLQDLLCKTKQHPHCEECMCDPHLVFSKDQNDFGDSS